MVSWQLAIASRKFGRDHKSVMVLLVLTLRGMVAIQAIHTFSCVLADLIFMHDGILRPRMAFGAFARGPYKYCIRLLCLSLRSGPIDQKCSQDQCKSNCHSCKHRPKGHVATPLR